VGLYLARRIGQSFRLLNQGEEVARVRVSDINQYKQIVLDVTAPQDWVILREEIEYDPTKDRSIKEEPAEEKVSLFASLFGKVKSKQEGKQ